jgi:hypothetical protein
LTTELDDIIKHYGVKGMKWGKRTKSEKSGNKTKERKIDEYHNKNSKRAVYSKLYNTNVKRGKSHHKAASLAKKQIRVANTVMAAYAMSVYAPGITRGITNIGKATVREAYKAATSPGAIRVGKNIVQAAKRSPIRYADASKFKNVVDMAGDTLMKL